MRTVFLSCLLFLGLWQPLTAQAQEAHKLDDALHITVNRLSSGMTAGSQVALLNFAADTRAAVSRIENQLTVLLREAKFTVINRQDIAVLEREQDFQKSGRVSDDEMLSIGQFLAAQFIITGSLNKEGSSWWLNVRVIDVKRAVTVEMAREKIKTDRDFIELVRRETESADPVADWKNHLLYVGVRAAYAQGFYQAGADLIPYTDKPGITGKGSVEGAISASLNLGYFFTGGFMRSLGLQTEVVYAADSFEAKWTGGNSQTVSYSSLMIPLFVKLTFRPRIFMLQGYGGGYLSVPAGKAAINRNGNKSSATFNVLGGFVAGGSAGIKLGPGVLFGDFRYLGDFSPLRANQGGGGEISRRSRIAISLGYEVGFF